MKTAAYPAAWPGTWTAYRLLLNALSDPPAPTDASYGGAQPPSSVIDADQGTAGNSPSVYFSYNTAEDVMFFRMRLTADPIIAGDLADYTWNVLFDVDGTGYKRFLCELNGSTGTIYIGYARTSSQAVVDGGCAAGQGVVWSSSYAIPTTVRSSAASGGGYFLDWQVPLDAFVDCNGTRVLTPDSTFTMAFTTSATHLDPTNYDYVDRNSTFRMTAADPVPFGNRIVPVSGMVTPPRVTNVVPDCVIGGPITLTGYTLDTIDISALNEPTDTIYQVTFSYRRAGTTDWIWIADITQPTALNEWTTIWDISGLPNGTCQIQCIATDDQFLTDENSNLYINIGTCGSTPVTLSSFAALAKPGVVDVVWETAAEIDDSGFHVWKGWSYDGPFSRITGSLVAARGGATWGADYGIEDRDVQDDRPVFYKLEAVNVQGESVFHGPIVPRRLSLLPLAPTGDASVAADRPATFEWNARGLEYFRLEISADPDFKGQVQLLPADGEFFGGGESYQSFTASRSEWSRLPGGHGVGSILYWRVIGRDSDRNEIVSAPSSFKLTGAERSSSSGRGGR